MYTFLFTDIEGSTKLWRDQGEAMRPALARHDALVLEVVAARGGRVVKHTGDGFFVVFENDDALAAALELQRRLQREDWGGAVELRARLALHVGEAEEREGDYFGPAVNLAARLAEVAWGGQTVVTADAAAALRLPSGAALTDLGVHVLRDVGTPQHVYQLAGGDLRYREFPPPRTASAPGGKLPAQPTPFVGREEDVAAITALLREPACRLLTLLGPGGIGKTRLALECAARLAGGFAWGAYFVPLAPLTRAEDIASAVGAALQFPFYGKKDAAAQLADYLADKDLLLVCDNFEHVIAGAPSVGALVAAAPGLKVVATSRERLNVQAEVTYDLGGMAYPAADAPWRWEDYSASRLFVITARRLQPEFDPSAADLPALRRICALVEGMPLALELAAPWVRTLAVPEIARELEASLDLLAGGGADLAPRHHSLRAVTDYSYGLLTTAERDALTRFAVFRGGFDRFAAREVAGASLPVLAALGDKSLVARYPGGRFYLHEYIRQYAAQRGAEDPTAGERVADAHAAYYLRFVADRRARLAGGDQAGAMEELVGEIDNIRAAWDRAAARGDADLVAAAAVPLSSLYRMRGAYAEGARLFERAAEGLAAHEASRGTERSWRVATARALALGGSLSMLLGRQAEATPQLRRAVALARRARSDEDVFTALNALGTGAFYRGERGRARRIYETCLSWARAAGDGARVTAALTNLGSLAGVERDLPRARQYLEETLILCRQAGDVNRATVVLNNLGSVYAWLGEYERAEGLFTESLAAARESGNRRLVCTSLANVGSIKAKRGAPATARPHFEEVLRLATELNDRGSILVALVNLATIANEQRDYAAALRLAEDALVVARERVLPTTPAVCYVEITGARLGLGEEAAARAAFVAGLEDALTRNDAATAVRLFGLAAEQLSRRGAHARAGEVMGAALAAAPDEDTRRGLELTAEPLRERGGDDFAQGLAAAGAPGLDAVVADLKTTPPF